MYRVRGEGGVRKKERKEERLVCDRVYDETPLRLTHKVLTCRKQPIIMQEQIYSTHTHTHTHTHY